MRLRLVAAFAAMLVGVVGLGGCGNGESDPRGVEAVGLCRGHDGVVAIEDEIVICRDQTAQETDGGGSDTRGAEAVGLCGGHGGVVALEDEIVICRDQTPQEIE
jgi:hypothetical protein